jgi:hypothetical protein
MPNNAHFDKQLIETAILGEFTDHIVGEGAGGLVDVGANCCEGADISAEGIRELVGIRSRHKFAMQGDFVRAGYSGHAALKEDLAQNGGHLR